MKIGIAYDLRSLYLAAGYTEEQTAELDREETIAALAGALEELGHTVVKIGNARSLIDKLASGDAWDVVFNVCEGVHGSGREAQVPAILDAFRLAYTFSDPLVMCVCLDKGLTKMVLERAGVPTSDFLVIKSPADVDQVTLPFPLFVKPNSEGTGKGISAQSKVSNRDELRERSADLQERFTQSLLVEPFLPGREFTVSILGSGKLARALGTLEILLRPTAEPEVYSYANKEQSEELVDYRLVTAADATVALAESAALAAWNALNCRDAGRVDLRCDAGGRPLVMEINPLAGMHPTHSDLPMTATAVGLEYRELVRTILDQAAQRSMTIPENRRKHLAGTHFQTATARTNGSHTSL